MGVQLVVALLANTRNGLTDLHGTRHPATTIGTGVDEVIDVLGGGKPAVGPLLVVCYTNHALDAFLEDLLDAGVPQVGDTRVTPRAPRVTLWVTLVGWSRHMLGTHVLSTCCLNLRHTNTVTWTESHQDFHIGTQSLQHRSYSHDYLIITTPFPAAPPVYSCRETSCVWVAAARASVWRPATCSASPRGTRWGSPTC